MIEAWNEPVLVAAIGLLGGIVLGLAARMGRFCTLGAIEDFLYGGNDGRLRMWGLAIGVAVTGSFALMGAGLFDPADSFYLSQAWSPLASIVGGLMFGYGMALAGNCGYGALARLGGGDIRSLVIVLVMGISALAAISGPLAHLRVFLFSPTPDATAPAGIAHLIAATTGAPVHLLGGGIGLAIICAVLAKANFRRDSKSLFWATCVGLSIVSAWAGTAYVHDVGFEGLPIVSHSFTGPVGQTLLYAMTSTGRDLSFGVGSVVGVLIGAFLGSKVKGHFRWEACDDARELRRQILGAAMMGIGGVVAVGCSIGQGLSAFSLLAFSAPITILAILAGATLGLRQLIEGFASAK